MGHVGKFCDGTEWRLGKVGQSCSAVCTDVGLACSDWGLASEASMRAALVAVGEDADTLCDYWSSSDRKGDPREEELGGIRGVHLRLCLCE